jgi:hypothetical protein
MIAAIWILLSASWAGHVGALFLPATIVMDLLMGQAEFSHRLILISAIIPQIVLVPWAWRDCGLRITENRSRRLWRIGFFFTGFVAVTAYLLKRRPLAQT